MEVIWVDVTEPELLISMRQETLPMFCLSVACLVYMARLWGISVLIVGCPGSFVHFLTASRELLELLDDCITCLQAFLGNPLW